MILTDSYLKTKIDKTTSYQFKNKETGFISTLDITKLKSGYEVEYTGNNFYRRTDGLNDMASVKNYIPPFSY